MGKTEVHAHGSSSDDVPMGGLIGGSIFFAIVAVVGTIVVQNYISNQASNRNTKSEYRR